jgi:hypothetical protein
VTEQPLAMLSGPTVFRVVWLPGSDRLRGYCWCGTPHESDGPVELWEWLLAHPDTHGGGPATEAPDPSPRERQLAGVTG